MFTRVVMSTFLLLALAPIASCQTSVGDCPDSWTVSYSYDWPGVPSSAEAVTNGKVIAKAEQQGEIFHVRDKDGYVDPRITVKETHYLAGDQPTYVGTLTFSTNKGHLVEEKRISGFKRCNIFQSWGSQW